MGEGLLLTIKEIFISGYVLQLFHFDILGLTQELQ